MTISRIKNRIAILSAAAALLSGCASFQSMDAPVTRTMLSKISGDKNIAPFKNIAVIWKNYPYKSATEYIGEGSAAGSPKLQPEEMPREDIGYLGDKAAEILKDSELYDAEKGSGTLTLTLTSMGKWTYGRLFRTFLVETPFIMILPASLKVNYHLTAEFETPEGKAKVEETAHSKTVFHALLFPLYPLFSPDSGERRLLKNMLWKISVDIHEKLAINGTGKAAPDTLPGREPVETPVSRNIPSI